ncbi:hypothetical protein P0Y35_15960 [Kiritimatiellaeota bacterium B1221]|nr:hypothetical protein [Kiritimatiellaeota bacterium B1221]
MSDEEKAEVLEFRISQHNPWHLPSSFEWGKWFHVTAACYEHKHLFGFSPQRMGIFSQALFDCFVQSQTEVAAWVLLPNHYHVLAKVHVLPLLKKKLGRLHGRMSHYWNVEEGMKGRKCFHGCSFRPIRSDAHKWSTFNYIHHNPVKHGYVDKWTDWAYGSARQYLKQTPRASVLAAWKAFPVLGMGKGWDDE